MKLSTMFTLREYAKKNTSRPHASFALSKFTLSSKAVGDKTKEMNGEPFISTRFLSLGARYEF